MNHKLSESLEDYLEAIAELIAVEGHAHTKEIAGKLNVKMPSVTGALRQLEQLGYITYNTHYPVSLTKEGELVAGKIIRRHTALTRFFSSILGLSHDKASETACRLEHAVDEDTVERFSIFSEALESRTDAAKLQIYLTEAMSFLNRSDYKDIILLSQASPGSKGTVEYIGRNTPEDERSRISIGNSIILNSVSLDKSGCSITVDGKNTTVSAAGAENIWIKLG